MKKNIIIVGSSKGLGKALALLLYKNNNLFLLSRKIDKAKFSQKNITKIACDITSTESIKEAFKKIDHLIKIIDGLINCAGVGLERNLEASTDMEINKVIKTNLLGAIFVSREAYKRMLRQKGGYIINISSTSGRKVREGETVYCASKWGLAGFSESLRLEAQKHNIRVTTVFPGGMKTDFYNSNPDKDTSGFMNPKYVAEQIVSLINSDPSICPSQLVIERA
jgi:short-subunit dehydrogenase